jgi:hypothetical protein
MFLLRSLSCAILSAMPDTPTPHPARFPLHVLLDAATMRRMDHVRRVAFARGDTPQAAADDVREVLLARHPALPLTLIDGAVEASGEGAQPEPPRHRVVRRFARRLWTLRGPKGDTP